jgi:hypothetical protein
MHNRVVEAARFDSEGKITFQYAYYVDVVNNHDSVFYYYNEKKKISEVRLINHQVPVGEEQARLSRDFGSGRRLVVSRFYYDGQPRWVRMEHFADGLGSEPEITIRRFDKQGRLVYLKRNYPPRKRSQDYVEWYYYNPYGRMFISKSIRANVSGSDTMRNLFLYTENGLKYREHRENILEQGDLAWVYDSAGRLRQMVSISQRYGKKYYFKKYYYYNSKGQLIEHKHFINDVLNGWERYGNNDKGLRSKVIWMNEQTGQEGIKFKIEYTYRE